MSKITLFTGPAGSYYYFKDKILEHIRSGDSDAYIYILPVNRAVRHFKKQLVIHSDSRALIDPPVFTFPALMRVIYDHFRDKKKIIPAALRLLHLQHVLEKHGDRLEYLDFKTYSAPGLISRIDKMLSELSQFGYRPGNFGPPPHTAECRYRDLEKLLNWLYESYNDEYIDETMIPAEVAGQLDDDAIQNVFPGLKNIYINGYGIYTPPMLKILSKIGQKYRVSVKLEYDTDNPVLFAHTRNAYDALNKISAKNEHISGQFSELKNQLFRHDISPAKPDTELSSYTLMAAKNRDEEVRYIAAKIRELHQLQNIPLHKFSVTFPDIEKYAPITYNLIE